MQTQNVFIAHPATTEQINALKALVKALNIKFEIKTSEKPYDQAFVDKILEGDTDFKAGKGKKMPVKELNRFWRDVARPNN